MRVFVLGAGASRHAGYPLASDMGNCLATWIKPYPVLTSLLLKARTGFFAGDVGSLGCRPVLSFRPDLEYIGHSDFVDPLCQSEIAASLPAMIMPALPKQFYFAFRAQGFSRLQRVATTFEGFLASEASKVDDDSSAPRPGGTTRSRLQALIGKQGIAFETRFTFIAVHPPSDLSAAEDDHDEDIEMAINRSHFLVRFDDGVMIDGSNTRIISGRDISRIIGRY